MKRSTLLRSTLLPFLVSCLPFLPCQAQVSSNKALTIGTNNVLLAPEANFFDTNFVALTNALTRGGFTSGGGGGGGSIFNPVNFTTNGSSQVDVTTAIATSASLASSGVASTNFAKLVGTSDTNFAKLIGTTITNFYATKTNAQLQTPSTTNLTESATLTVQGYINQTASGGGGGGANSFDGNEWNDDGSGNIFCQSIQDIDLQTIWNIEADGSCQLTTLEVFQDVFADASLHLATNLFVGTNAYISGTNFDNYLIASNLVTLKDGLLVGDGNGHNVADFTGLLLAKPQGGTERTMIDWGNQLLESIPSASYPVDLDWGNFILYGPWYVSNNFIIASNLVVSNGLSVTGAISTDGGNIASDGLGDLTITGAYSTALMVKSGIGGDYVASFIPADATADAINIHANGDMLSANWGITGSGHVSATSLSNTGPAVVTGMQTNSNTFRIYQGNLVDILDFAGTGGATASMDHLANLTIGGNYAGASFRDNQGFSTDGLGDVNGNIIAGTNLTGGSITLTNSPSVVPTGVTTTTTASNSFFTGVFGPIFSSGTAGVMVVTNSWPYQPGSGTNEQVFVQFSPLATYSAAPSYNAVTVPIAILCTNYGGTNGSVLTAPSGAFGGSPTSYATHTGVVTGGTGWSIWVTNLSSALRISGFITEINQ